MTLIEFLTARLDEDEAVARAAMAHVSAERLRRGETHWHAVEYHFEGIGVHGWPDDGDTSTERSPTTAHITRHDPARVLAEVEAKRRIVENHKVLPEEIDVEEGVVFAPDCPDCWQTWPCSTLRHLASVYADHPDYREEWTP